MSPMNNLDKDLQLRCVPTKFDCDQIRIAKGRVVSGLADQTNKLAF